MKGVAKRLSDIAAKADSAFADLAANRNSKAAFDGALANLIAIKGMATTEGLIHVHAKHGVSELHFNMDCGISALCVKDALTRDGWAVVINTQRR